MTWHKRPEYPFQGVARVFFPTHTVRRPGNGASRMQIRRLALVFFSAIEFDSCHFCSQKKGAGGNYNVLRNHRPDLFPLSSSELINLPPFFALPLTSARFLYNRSLKRARRQRERGQCYPNSAIGPFAIAPSSQQAGGIRARHFNQAYKHKLCTMNL